jgi:hypothetical protein
MFTLAFQSLTLYPSWVINIESNQETPAERKARAARIAAKRELDGMIVRPFPAPGGSVERRQGHSALRVKAGKLETFDPHPDSTSRDIDWSQCPNCAKRKAMSRDRKAKQRSRHAN